MLTRLPTEEVRGEITRSKRDIEVRLGRPCSLFAYPYGDFNAEVVQLVKESGFTGAVTAATPKLLGKNPEDLFVLSRITAGPNFYTFKGTLSGLYPDLMTALSWVKGQGL